MKNKFYIFPFLIILGLVIVTACEPDNDEEDFAIATTEWGKLSITLSETGGPTNEWYFASTGSSGMAALTGVGDYSFTYSRTGTNASTLKFQVAGEDKFDMTWTSALSGTFQQSFNGTAGNPGSFSIVMD
jgi:hypothetical protein